MTRQRYKSFTRVAICSAILILMHLGHVEFVLAQDTEDAVIRFWRATDEELVNAKRRIRDLSVEFDDLYETMRTVDRYTIDVPKGQQELVRRNGDDTVHRFVVIVPASYDPVKSYPVRVYLHGGVRRPEWDSGGRWWRQYDALTREDELAVFPAAWTESTWWQASQAENLAGILHDLKAVYNIDDNRVYLFGVSDGGTGVYFHAFKAPTPWAAFVPMIGHPSVLANPRVGADGEMFPVNLSNRPFYILNGESDRLYPVRSMRPWIRFFQDMDVDITFRPVNAGHTVQWWPTEAAEIERFIVAKVRDPLPERIIWETERTDRYNRLHWLVVDDLGPPGSQHPRLSTIPSHTNGLPVGLKQNVTETM